MHEHGSAGTGLCRRVGVVPELKPATGDGTLTRILIVEDQMVARKALAIVLALEPTFKVVGETGSLAETRALLGKIDVDIVLLDLQLPDGNSLTILPEIRAAYPRAGVVVLTASTEPSLLALAEAMGATVMHKSTGLRELRRVLQQLSSPSRHSRPAAEVVDHKQ